MYDYNLLKDIAEVEYAESYLSDEPKKALREFLEFVRMVLTETKK